MKKLILLSFASIFLASTAHAQVNYDANITAIFGSGNPNTDWNSVEENGFVLGLRAKERFVAPAMTHTDDVYQMPATSPAVNRSSYNIELSIESLNDVIGDVDGYLKVDTDPSVGITYSTANVLRVWPSGASFGDATTANGAGVEQALPTVSAEQLASVSSVVQLSQNLGFGEFVLLGVQNPSAEATRDFVLYVVPKGAGADATPLASIHIQVVTGNGGQTVDQLIAGIDTTNMNHGDYVNAVKAISNYLFDGGVLNNKERSVLISTAAKSAVGK